MNEWIEVLKTGTHTASSGEKVTIDDAYLQRIAANYDAGHHEAPLVLGHPKDNSPAYGWIEALKVDGGKLLAKLKQVAPELRELVREGRFKHRSASIYSDLDGKGPYLRHIGFLGAQPPAIKGLAPVSFGDGAAVSFEFEERSNEMDESKIRQMLTEFAEKIQNGISSVAAKLKPASNEPSGSPDMRQQIADAVKAATDQLTAQFTEQVNTLKTQLTEQGKQLTKAEHDARTAGIRNFADRLKAAGHWVPAFDKMHLLEFMESIACATAVVEFSDGEGDKKKDIKQSPLEYFQNFLEKLPKLVEFRELTADVAPGAPPNVVQFQRPDDSKLGVQNVELANRTVAIQREKKISFEEAAAIARTEVQAG